MTAFAELSEQQASGELARIYAEIRDAYGAPYVSSLQRHFATYPGVLPWAWGVVAPGFDNGLIQRTAWCIARDTNQEQALDALNAQQLRDLGVDAAGEHAIRNVCENFVRVAPVNLLFAGCIRALLEGAALPCAALASDQSSGGAWQAPPSLPPLPELCDLAQLPAPQRAMMDMLSTRMGEQVFVPGLYRMLAHWPAYIQHIAPVLGLRLGDAGFRQRGEHLAQQITNAVPMILASLPTPPSLPAPEEELGPALLEAIVTYRRTSPEMVMVGSLLLHQLPAS
jgi:hypothetical protein